MWQKEQETVCGTTEKGWRELLMLARRYSEPPKKDKST